VAAHVECLGRTFGGEHDVPLPAEYPPDRFEQVNLVVNGEDRLPGGPGALYVRHVSHSTYIPDY
jgi:hypothetical protein